MRAGVSVFERISAFVESATAVAVAVAVTAAAAVAAVAVAVAVTAAAAAAAAYPREICWLTRIGLDEAHGFYAESCALSRR